MNQIYFRKEPTNDELLNNKSFSEDERKELSRKKDTVAYLTMEDVEKNNPNGRWMWFWQYAPRNKNQKTIIYNCSMKEIVWLPDLEN